MKLDTRQNISMSVSGAILLTMTLVYLTRKTSIDEEMVRPTWWAVSIETFALCTGIMWLLLQFRLHGKYPDGKQFPLIALMVICSQLGEYFLITQWLDFHTIPVWVFASYVGVVILALIWLR
jgi:hypothetical protein